MPEVSSTTASDPTFCSSTTSRQRKAFGAPRLLNLSATTSRNSKLVLQAEATEFSTSATISVSMETSKASSTAHHTTKSYECVSCQFAKAPLVISMHRAGPVGGC